ncbi:uncharacterized protein LOC143913598 isoform X2 [Arctopsyche grandis]|uniref:uncharacterized protein LOC143913598 isoform X2 n=1 Tax=Arctopsyche grandis TaxID=121162 RepID=UPI00406D6347
MDDTSESTSSDSLNSEPLDLCTTKLENNNLSTVQSENGSTYEKENIHTNLPSTLALLNSDNEDSRTINEHPIIDINIDLNPDNYFTSIPFPVELTMPPKNNQNSVQCEVCGKEYKQKRNLIVHKRNIHGVEDYASFYPCEICNKNIIIRHTTPSRLDHPVVQ